MYREIDNQIIESSCSPDEPIQAEPPIELSPNIISSNGHQNRTAQVERPRKRKRRVNRAQKLLLKKVIFNIEEHKKLMNEFLNKEVTLLTVFADSVSHEFSKWPLTAQTGFIQEITIMFEETQRELREKNLI